MLIFNYHEINVGNDYPAILSPELFEAQIQWLIDQGFRFFTLDEILDENFEDDEKVCVITFDDGRLGAFTSGAQILRKYSIRANYFVCPDWVENQSIPISERYSKFMNWSHIRELNSEGHVIGSHSMSHVHFFGSSEDVLSYQISESKKKVEDRLSVSCDHLAAPRGEVDQRVIELAKRFQYKTLSSAIPGWNKKPYSLFNLRRVSVLGSETLTEFKAQILKWMEDSRKFHLLVLRESDGRILVPLSSIAFMARFDLIMCSSEFSYQICRRYGLPCVQEEFLADIGQDSTTDVNEYFRKQYSHLSRNRDLTLTFMNL